MIAYRCRDGHAFDQGLCLDCKKNCCNTLGYDVNKVHTGASSKGLYLKTGPQTPFKGQCINTICPNICAHLTTCESETVSTKHTIVQDGIASQFPFSGTKGSSSNSFQHVPVYKTSSMMTRLEWKNLRFLHRWIEMLAAPQTSSANISTWLHKCFGGWNLKSSQPPSEIKWKSFPEECKGFYKSKKEALVWNGMFTKQREMSCPGVHKLLSTQCNFALDFSTSCDFSAGNDIISSMVRDWIWTLTFGTWKNACCVSKRSLKTRACSSRLS